MQSALLNPARQQTDETKRLESLAQEMDTSIQLVKAIYSEELKAIEDQAKVRTYVSVIAMRRTRLILRSLESKVPAPDMH